MKFGMRWLWLPVTGLLLWYDVLFSMVPHLYSHSPVYRDIGQIRQVYWAVAINTALVLLMAGVITRNLFLQITAALLASVLFSALALLILKRNTYSPGTPSLAFACVVTLMLIAHLGLKFGTLMAGKGEWTSPGASASLDHPLLTSSGRACFSPAGASSRSTIRPTDAPTACGASFGTTSPTLASRSQASSLV